MREHQLRLNQRIPFFLLAFVLLALGTAACGGAKRAPRAARIATAQEAKAEPPPPHDLDDLAFLDTARPASAAVSRAVSAVVSRFYVVAAKGNGAQACSLLLPSLAVATPIDYGGSVGPSYLRGGKTCAEIMTRLFRYARAQLTGSIEVTQVRTVGNRAYVLLHSTTLPYPYITVIKYGNTWKVVDLIGATLP